MVASAGVVLAGGLSSRMGSPKASLEWHGSTLLRRTAGIVARAAAGPVVIVRAPGQDLPALPDWAEVVDDPREGKGPVQGIAAGLAALAGRAEVAFVASTDMPFLHPAFVRRVLDAAADGTDVALPVARGYWQPLAAAYRTGLAPLAERLVAADQLRPAYLLDQCAVTRLDEAALCADPVLAALDPGLDSLVNLNEPGDYRAARAEPAPEVTLQPLGALAGPGLEARQIRAATVAGAAAAANLTATQRRMVAVLNGDQVIADGQTPLAAGDSLFFVSAGLSG
jgi:molybdopterin-guanine dinucleotide biosynthesis protein A